MRNFILILSCVCIIYGSAYANTSIKVTRFHLLRDAVTRMIPVFKKNMLWEQGGVGIDTLVDYLRKNETGVYKLYPERGLRLQLGKAMEEELRGKVFRVQFWDDNRSVSKYFLGTEPNIHKIIDEILGELQYKLKQENGGLSMDEIIAKLKEVHPAVYNLYVLASSKTNDRGLRIALSKALDEKLDHNVFYLVIGVDGEQTRKYFLGQSPDLKAIVNETLIALSAKLEWGKGGLSTDEIVAKIKERHPTVYSLYVQASNTNTDSGLRLALGEVMDKKLNGGIFSMPVSVGDKYINKYFSGKEPDLEAIIASVFPRLRHKMQWQQGGLSMDEIVAAVRVFYRDVYTLYIQTSYNNTDAGLRIALGRALEKRLQQETDVFTIQVNVGNRKPFKYLEGKKPDIESILAAVLPRVSYKLKVENGGLIMDDVMAEVKALYPHVHTLYVQASSKGNDYGLRTLLGKELEKVQQGSIFRMLVDTDDNKKVFKYFYGREPPDIKAVLNEIISTPKIKRKMRVANGGVRMHEIIAAFKEFNPDTYALYVLLTSS